MSSPTPPQQDLLLFARAAHRPRPSARPEPYCASALAAQHPGRHPMRHRSAVGAVADRIGHQAPPVALLAQTPAATPALDNLVHLQTGRVIATAAVRLARKQRR